MNFGRTQTDNPMAMDKTSRREFLGGGAALLAALGWDGCVSVPGFAKRLPAWRPGDLDLHFIYVGCMWCPSQAYPATLDRLVAEKSATGGRPLILPQLITDEFQRPWFESRGFELPHPGAAHVVIRVPPEGDRYRVYLLDAHDEEMRIVAEFERKC